MSIADKLMAKGVRVTTPAGPLWKGPVEDGITFSMLTKFLTCRERFRVRYVEGWRPADRFSHRMEYGNMWHVCEEALAGHGNHDWHANLREYTNRLCNRYPMDRKQVAHWYNVCRVQFPLYVEHWSKHPDVTARTPLLQEQVFDVPYALPSGRTVRLRGKWDAVDLIGKGKAAGVYLQENKTKGDVDHEAIQRQLTFDLQTMMYLVALGTPKPGHSGAGRDVKGWPYGVEVKGVWYNVVRRPLSGGKGTIVRHKPTKSNPSGESQEAYYDRLRGIIAEEPGHYFSRYKVEVSPADVTRFRRECLDPILEGLCDWWEWLSMLRDYKHDDPFTTPDEGNCGHNVGIHWRHPFGSVNTIDEYGASDVDEYVNTGSTVGLVRADRLFEELQ